MTSNQMPDGNTSALDHEQNKKDFYPSKGEFEQAAEYIVEHMSEDNLRSFALDMFYPFHSPDSRRTVLDRYLELVFDKAVEIRTNNHYEEK